MGSCPWREASRCLIFCGHVRGACHVYALGYMPSVLKAMQCWSGSRIRAGVSHAFVFDLYLDEMRHDNTAEGVAVTH